MTDRRPTERADAARNRRAILDATAALLAEHGAAGVTMDRVAAAAGVAGVAAGETVLVEAAATGVGGCLTQLCAAAGVRVIGTAGGEQKARIARDNGADDVLDHTAPDWADQLADLLTDGTVDVVFDSIGGESLTPLLDLITPLRGRILSYGWLDGSPAQLGVTELILGGLTLTGCAGAAWLGEVARQRSTALPATAQGHLTPLIDSILPLADAAHAHRKLEGRIAFGTVLLRP
ncbi:zinc-binding alcohol dehydrogenase family protein [Nocardia sp. NPDC060249]|uniref:quinone oxidoreductase family protein n=1 Tax=Nocardia sp. NPDC060249 TaxID=3347082 RepID=UPI00364E3837